MFAKPLAKRSRKTSIVYVIIFERDVIGSDGIHGVLLRINLKLSFSRDPTSKLNVTNKVIKVNLTR